MAGAAVQWLRDGIKVIGKAAHSGQLADKPTSAERLSGAGLRRAWCAALGCRGEGRDLRADPQLPGRRNSRAQRLKRSPIRRVTCSTP